MSPEWSDESFCMYILSFSPTSENKKASLVTRSSAFEHLLFFYLIDHPEFPPCGIYLREKAKTLEVNIQIVYKTTGFLDLGYLT